jgi:hypothetical protein
MDCCISLCSLPPSLKQRASRRCQVLGQVLVKEGKEQELNAMDAWDDPLKPAPLYTEGISRNTALLGVGQFHFVVV